MKISVITAVYNRKETISRALLSIRNQSYKNVEIVVVDGGSSDGTQEAVKSVLDENDYFISEPDDGIYDALNKGLTAATGEIICFLHSDDIYNCNDALSSVVQVFESDVDVVYGDVSFFTRDKTDSVVRVYRSDKLNVKNLTWGKMPAHPAIFIRRKIYDSIGIFKTDYIIAADYEFLCRMVTSMNCTSVYLPRLIVRMQMGGVSTAGFRNSLQLNKEVLRACRENGLKTNILMLLTKYPSKLLQFLRK